MGSFSGLAKAQGAAGQWLAQGTTLVAAECIWMLSCTWGRVGEELGLPGGRKAALAFASPPLHHFPCSPRGATGAEQNQHSLKCLTPSAWGVQFVPPVGTCCTLLLSPKPQCCWGWNSS